MLMTLLKYCHRILRCSWTCLHYRGLCCSWRCLHTGAWAATGCVYTKDAYVALEVSTPQLRLDVPTLQRPVLLLEVSTPQKHEMHSYGSTLQRPVLHLDVSTPKGPQMHLDLAGQQEPVLLLDVSTLQECELYLDEFRLQEPLLLLALSALLRPVLHLDGSTPQWPKLPLDSKNLLFTWKEMRISLLWHSQQIRIEFHKNSLTVFPSQNNGWII